MAAGIKYGRKEQPSRADGVIIRQMFCFGKRWTIDIRIVLCDTGFKTGGASQPAILIEEEVVPMIDCSLKQSAVASLLALE
jgi:hypothetical protein